MPISSLLAFALTVSLSTPVNLQSQSIEQLVQTGNAALNDRRSSEAETAWREVLKRDPKNGMAYLKLGDSLRIGRQFEAAQAAYKKAIELTPKQIDGYLALADLLQYTKVDEAERVYRQAIVNARPNAKVYAGLAQVLKYDPFGTRVFSAAEIAERTLCWQKAIELDPKILNTMFNSELFWSNKTLN